MAETKVYRAHEGFQDFFVKTNVDICFGGGNLGAGKLHPLDTKVLTPNGWVAIGNLKEGDLINTPFGAPAKLLHIFEHKNKDIYRLTTSDGRSVECGLEHLWSIRTQKQMYKYHNGGGKGDYLTTCDTAELIKRLKNGKKSYLPIPDGQEFSEKEFEIPPYVLGVMIGDGCLTDKTWAFDTAFCVSNTEQDIIDKVAEQTGTTKVYWQERNNTKKFYTPKAKRYKDYCASIGLNTYSYNKFIPKEYLFGSVRQRKELLAGLFDTDGHIASNGCYSYSTTSHKLCEDIVSLCRSLGYIATVSYDNRTDKYTNDKAFKVCIQTPDKVFSSEKHNKRWNSVYSKEKCFIRKRDHVYVTSIEKTRTADARCIYIDDPLHLYIVDDFIVTHNTFGAALSIAEPLLDSNWRGLVVKNNIDDLKRGGGVIDTFSKELYGEWAQLRMSDMPRMTFPYGSWIDFAHLADQSVDAILRRFKSSQYDWIYFDELTEFSWDAFKTLITRNRGKSKYSGKIRATTNPERESWIRVFIDWYVGDDGHIIPERNGVVRYFFIMGNTVNEVCWGDTKEEVYRHCKFDIDKLCASQKTKDWEQFIKSFTFYEGKMSENKEMLENNPGYVGTIAMMGGAERDKLLGGNWNVSSKDEEGVLVSFDEASSVFTNDAQRNGDKWITVDLADSGTNNFVQLAWDGLDVIDIDIAPYTTPEGNATRTKIFAAKHNIGYSHIIFDAIRGMYFKDYIPEAIPFESYRAPMGINALQYTKLKDCCYGKLIYLIKNNLISISYDVARRTYINAASKTKSDLTVENEFIEEIRVVRWVDAPNGKKRLMTKKEMNKALGRGRSMDLADPMSMRMYPLLDIADGYELENSKQRYSIYQDDMRSGNRVNIYDDSNFGISYG